MNIYILSAHQRPARRYEQADEQGNLYGFTTNPQLYVTLELVCDGPFPHSYENPDFCGWLVQSYLPICDLDQLASLVSAATALILNQGDPR